MEEFLLFLDRFRSNRTYKELTQVLNMAFSMKFTVGAVIGKLHRMKNEGK